MALDTGVLLLVLMAAVMHASWNALVKAGSDRLVMTALVMVVPSIPCMIALFFLPTVGAAAWPYLILSTLVHFAYYGLLIGAYRHGDLSQVYPIARGVAPALVAVGAWVFVNETLNAVEMLGVLIVSIGIMSLAWRRGVTFRDGEIKAIGFAFATGLSIAIYLLTDGIGGRRAESAATYICWLFALEGFPLLAFTLWRRRGRVAASFRPHLVRGSFGGIIAAVSYGITIWAMSVGPMAHIVAVRETSVIFGAIFGTLLLKEPFGAKRITAAAVVAGGAVLLNIGG